MDPDMASIRKITKSAVEAPEGDCQPSTAVAKVWFELALLASSVWISVANWLVSVDERSGQPCSGSGRIIWSRVGLPAANAGAARATMAAGVAIRTAAAKTTTSARADLLSETDLMGKSHLPRGSSRRGDRVVEYPGGSRPGLWLQVEASRRRNDPRKATCGC
jgi:hypothetical protein